jgi:5'-methylthioadenosine phosphorylase
MAKIGVIGGSGLYKIEGIENVETLSLFTPFGQPSGNFIKGKLAGVEVVFLPRHGKDHAISPTEINYRANIFGMKKLGVQAIISVSACGSLREEMKPMDFVVPDQFVDLTKHRKSSFFEGGVVGHVSVADPFSPEIRKIIIGAARELKLTVHDQGTYVNMEGPQFSTRAESNRKIVRSIPMRSA